jgi:hypothetical protein
MMQYYSCQFVDKILSVFLSNCDNSRPFEINLLAQFLHWLGTLMCLGRKPNSTNLNPNQTMCAFTPVL